MPIAKQGVQQVLACLQIGRDPRISGPLLAAALAAGLTSKGVRVARFGYATTPAMFMSTIIEGELLPGLCLAPLKLWCFQFLYQKQPLVQTRP